MAEPERNPVMIEEITYLRIERPSTINQYMVRRFMKDEANKNARVHGVTNVNGKLMPKSAREVQKSMKGMTSEKIRGLHPEWADDYPAYVKEWHKKQCENHSIH